MLENSGQNFFSFRHKLENSGQKVAHARPNAGPQKTETKQFAAQVGAILAYFWAILAYFWAELSSTF